MKKDDPGRRFSREFKLSAVQRMSLGASVSKLARELGISRKGLYQWQKQFGGGGAPALRQRPRSPHGAGISHPLAADETAVATPAIAPNAFDELLKALARIAELERIVGQQTVDLYFFQQALHHVGTARESDAPGGTASTRSSKR